VRSFDRIPTGRCNNEHGLLPNAITNRRSIHALHAISTHQQGRDQLTVCHCRELWLLPAELNSEGVSTVVLQR
jgi:hypothetical protein